MEENGKYFEIRPVSGFSKIIIKVVGCLELHQEPIERLIIYGGEDVLKRIHTGVIDKALTITYNSDWLNILGVSLFNPESIHFSISAPCLEEIALHSPGSLTMRGLTAAKLTLSLDGPGIIKLSEVELSNLITNLTGVGSIEIAGSTQSQSVRLSGAGTYRTPNLESQYTNVLLSGFGNARVFAQQQLDVTLSGAGSVEYLGHPLITQKITGLGMLKPMNIVSI